MNGFQFEGSCGFPAFVALLDGWGMLQAVICRFRVWRIQIRMKIFFLYIQSSISQ